MTLYELTAPQTAPAEGLFSRAASTFRNVLHKMQYGRMVQVMSQMSDVQLDVIGVSRADIPNFAREILEK